MRAFPSQRRGLALVVPGLLAAVVAVAAPSSAAGDEPGLFGRLFRLGGSSSSSPSTPGRARSAPAANPLPYGPKAPGASNRAPHAHHDHDHSGGGGGNDFVPPAAPRSPGPAANSAPAPTPTVGPLGGGPSTPEVIESGSANPVAPRPRVSSAVTSADPILTRVALGRSTDGSQFGMFLQIYADGTVIDSEGVHRLSPADIKPIADMVASGELSRNRGHCGAPSSDFIEDVQIIVYEKRLGRLSAQPFSYSGNPQDCDHSVKHLHTLIDNLMMKMSGQPVAAADPGPGVGSETTAPVLQPTEAAAAPPSAPGNAPRLGGAGNAPDLPQSGGPVIPLTPVEEK